MISVLHVAACPFPLAQGSQVYVAGMVRALARRGLRVGVAAYGHGEGAWPEGVDDVRAWAPVPLRHERSGPHLGKPALDALLTARVARHLLTHRVDVLHAHNVEAPLVARLATKVTGRRIPVVYNLHTALEEELPVYGPPWAREAAARVGRAVDRGLAADADAAVAISARAEAVLRAHGARRVVRIPPGVDADELRGGDAARARARWGLGAGRWVTYTGNADPYQDLDVLLAAMVQVPEAGLLVVGPSPEAPILRAAAGLGLPAERLRVHRSGALADALDALAVAELAVVPRAVCAGFPIKVLNALGAGRATVVAQGAAPPIEGVLPVAGGDPSALAGAVRGALASPAMTARLGEAAARAVRGAWSWEVRAAQLHTLYAELSHG